MRIFLSTSALTIMHLLHGTLRLLACPIYLFNQARGVQGLNLFFYMPLALCGSLDRVVSIAESSIATTDHDPSGTSGTDGEASVWNLDLIGKRNLMEGLGSFLAVADNSGRDARSPQPHT